MYKVTFKAIIENVWKTRIEKFQSKIEMDNFIKRFLKKYPYNSYYFIHEVKK